MFDSLEFLSDVVLGIGLWLTLRTKLQSLALSRNFSRSMTLA